MNHHGRSRRRWAGRAIVLAGWACVLAAAHAALAQQPPAASPTDESGRWALETVALADGAHFRGLVLLETEAELDFAEIVQPPGKPMYGVVRGIRRQDVESIERLPAKDHQDLLARFQRFRDGAVIEAGRIDEVRLTPLPAGSTPGLEYTGEWFKLTSTADEERTRQCVVRIEQMFRAYRTLLAPKIAEPRPLSIALYGSMDDYKSRLRELELDLDNAAFYSPREGVILAGSDLNPFAERLAQLRRQHEEARRTYARLDVEFARSMAVLRGELKSNGFSDEEATDEIRQRKATWKAHMEAALTSNAQRQRSNEQKFAEVTRQMFARLRHEAFHAYLGAFVYPPRTSQTPRWLNEGLAQVFETAQLDGDSLRIDAPDRERLARLKQDLAADPLPLEQVLTAEEYEFLGPHGGRTSERHYLYAWGLAYHLAFESRMLGTSRLDAYVRRDAEPPEAVARFEKLVGRPLAQFEREWRAAMMSR